MVMRRNNYGDQQASKFIALYHPQTTLLENLIIFISTVLLPYKDTYLWLLDKTYLSFTIEAISNNYYLLSAWIP